MSDDGPGAREVAYRPFAAEFDDASLSYSESDEERAPNYVVTPTGARINRLFAVGVLTEVERINDDTRRGRIVDPSGAFVTYAGQYQPEAQTFLERAETPSFVALTGKARTFEPEDSDRVFTSVRPESANEVDADTRDRWVVSAAESTLDRLAVFELARESSLRGDELRAALEAGGAPASLAAGVPLALDHYDTSPAYVEAIRRLAVDALELIAGDRSEVRSPTVGPDEGGDVAVGPLPETDVTIVEPDEETPAMGEPPESAETVEEPPASEPSEAAEESSITAESSPEDPISAEDPTDTTASAEPDVDAAEPDVDAAELDAEPADTSATDTLDDTGTSADSDDADPLGEGDAPADADALGEFDGSLSPDESKESGTDVDEHAEEPGADEVDIDVGDEMYEIDDDERDRIESEFGTEFSTGSEVDDPGEADIDVPEPDDGTDAGTADAGTTDASAADSAGDGGLGDFDEQVSDETGPSGGGADETDDADADADAETSAADVDLEAVAVETMASLDEGDGADHDAVVDAVVSEYGVDASDVEGAIEDALMSGKCYEPGDGVLKAI